jgi:hypothetical protein
MVNNCLLNANQATTGGGAYASTLSNCTVAANSGYYGGGAYGSTVLNSVLTGNTARYYGGGAEDSLLNNCTLTGNSAQRIGGGAYSNVLNNCIVYFNTAPEGQNHQNAVLNYCCTTPLTAGGSGSITADPLLASPSRLSAGSPCRGRGSAAYATGADIDGEAWGTPPSIGCDEFQAGALTGPLSVAIAATFTNVAAGFPVQLTGLIQGLASANSWDFGDGTSATNKPYVTHSWNAPGEYDIVFRAFNETLPGGAGASVTIHVVAQPVQYVAADSANPAPPYTSWATAATTIQDAVDHGYAGGQIVVSNGIYATGGRAVHNAMTNRVAVDKPLLLRSVNGPPFTIIQGYQVPGTTNGDGAIRCVYLTNGASLVGFTLTNGATRAVTGSGALEANGGGVFCESTNEVISNCVLIANCAAGNGGGSYVGTLNDCTLTGNVARSAGGGAFGGILNHCTLTANSAGMGGGASSGYPIQTQPPLTLNNCVLIGNTASSSGGGAAWGTLNHCTLTGNSAGSFGGGADVCTLNYCILRGNSTRTTGIYGFGGGSQGGTLNHCLVTGNSAKYGRGTWSGKLNNCTVVGNTAGGCDGPVRLTNCVVDYFNPNYPDAFASYCCTTRQPTNGVGNITNAPLFVNQAAGDFRLQPTSPCINAGNNAAVSVTTDLDGNPRIVGGVVDIGAYECQSPDLLGYYLWLAARRA